ncbi:MAG TPA: OmpA family protein [Burkholderiaceae bacterium]|nr:OmpA family protein [Burkholderiaceae bacterium]
MTTSGLQTRPHNDSLGRNIRLAFLTVGIALTLPACQTATPTAPVAAPSASATSAQASAPRPAAPAAAAPAPAAAPPAPPPPEPVAFDLAIERAATALFSSAERNPELIARAPRPVMIDPLIDGNTAQQTIASAAMGRKIADVMSSKFNRFAVTPFRKNSLDGNPLLLVGTLTAINAAGSPQARNDLYRICLALVDVKAGKVVAKGVGRATEQSVDHTPLAFYGDSPALVKDKIADGYVKTCQGTRAGDPADSAYLEGLPTAMLIDEAVNAYQAGRYSDAKKLYKTASQLPGGAQKRVVTGLYLTSWKLRQTRDAEAAFKSLVDTALEEKRLGMKFLFQPGSTQFVANPDLRAQYGMWTRVIGARAASGNNCLTVMGHTSRTGTDPVNDALSLKRAEVMSKMLEQRSTALRKRLTAQGAGSRETIVGSGTDDARDAIDRRVEFRLSECKTS